MGYPVSAISCPIFNIVKQYIGFGGGFPHYSLKQKLPKGKAGKYLLDILNFQHLDAQGVEYTVQPPIVHTHYFAFFSR